MAYTFKRKTNERQDNSQPFEGDFFAEVEELSQLTWLEVMQAQAQEELDVEKKERDRE